MGRRQSVASKTMLDLHGDGCFSGEIIVDPGDQIIESDERNNRRELEVTRPGAAGPGVRDKRNNQPNEWFLRVQPGPYHVRPRFTTRQDRHGTR